MPQKISEVKVGQKVQHGIKGDGMVTNVTKRTITITWGNGNVCKNTYRYNDAYFYPSDF